MGWQDAPEATDAPAAAPSWQSAPLDQSQSGPKPVFSGSILPFSKYADGSVGFDSNAGVVGIGKRLGQSALGAIENLPGLARRTGAETAANTATPQTAGQVGELAGMTATGDMMAPGLPGGAKTFTRAAVERPDADELHALGGAQADTARDMGVDYSIPHIGAISSSVEQKLYDQGILPTDAPRTYAKLSAMRAPPPGATHVPITGLEGIRRGFSSLTADKTATGDERRAAAIAFGDVHDFMVNPPPEAVLAGPAAEAGQLLAASKANHAAAFNSDRITNTDIASEDRAASAYSGRNYDNIVRQQLRPIIDPRRPANAAGFNKDEVQAIRGVVRGNDTFGRNALRKVGNLGAGGHGVGTSVLGMGAGALGYQTMGMPGIAAGFAAPAIGSIARSAENKIAGNAIEGLAGKMTERSPLYRERVANAPLVVDANAPGMAAVRAASPQPDPDQPQYAKGGAVKKPTHEFLVQRLMKLAEKAKKAEKKVTAPILNMPDDTVTAALAKAQAAI